MVSFRAHFHHEKIRNMMRALIFALALGMSTSRNIFETWDSAKNYEWAGIFATPESTYTWIAQKATPGTDGVKAYADPTMTIAAIPAGSASKLSLAISDSFVPTQLQNCEDVQSGGTITPSETKCYKLVFNQGSNESQFILDASAAENIAFFAQHLPTEFEDTKHYLKDTSEVDIEPSAEWTGGGHGHDHSHDHGHGDSGGGEEFGAKCVCQAASKGWVLDCTQQAKIREAMDYLSNETAMNIEVCGTKTPTQTCIDEYHVMQAHHDHCLHDQLPSDIEKKLHFFEDFYQDCFVKRQYDASLSACPAVNCSDATVLTAATDTLIAGCRTVNTCAESACSAAIKTVLMAHDTCPEEDLPTQLELALHDHEDPCAAELCNGVSAPFNPYDDPCGPAPAPATAPSATPSTAPSATPSATPSANQSATPATATSQSGTASAARGFGSQEAVLVTTLALPLAMFFSFFFR